LRRAESTDVAPFLGSRSARIILVLTVIAWAFVGARVWLGKNLAGLKNAQSTGDAFLNKIVLNPFFALRYAVWQEHAMQRSAGLSTIESLGVIITGLPFARAFVNFQPLVRKGLPTAAAAIFKQLGYKPRFFYGGYLSWQRIGEFCREQGFEDVYGGDQMVPHAR